MRNSFLLQLSMSWLLLFKHFWSHVSLLTFNPNSEKITGGPSNILPENLLSQGIWLTGYFSHLPQSCRVQCYRQCHSCITWGLFPPTSSNMSFLYIFTNHLPEAFQDLTNTFLRKSLGLYLLSGPNTDVSGLLVQADSSGLMQGALLSRLVSQWTPWAPCGTVLRFKSEQPKRIRQALRLISWLSFKSHIVSL